MRSDPGPQVEADGSLSLHLQHDAPEDERDGANWLPVPRQAFQLVARLYWPKPELLEGRWLPPAVRAVGPVEPVERQWR